MIDSSTLQWHEIVKACKAIPFKLLRMKGIYVYRLDKEKQKSLDMPFRIHKFIIFQTSDCKSLPSNAELIDDIDSIKKSHFTCFTGPDEGLEKMILSNLDSSNRLKL